MAEVIEKARVRRSTLWTRHLSFLTPQQKKFATAYRAEMHKLRAASRDTKNPFNVGAWSTRVAKALRPTYRSIMHASGRRYLGLLFGRRRKRAVDMFTKAPKRQRVAQVMVSMEEDFMDRLEKTVQTTWNGLHEVMIEAIADDLDGDEIDELIDDEWADVLGRRTDDISLTESNGAINSVDDLLSSVLVEAQAWVNAADERVRPNHVIYAEAGPKPVGFNWADLADGNYTLRFPCDPQCREAGDVVNCRCFVVPEGAIEIPEDELADYLEEFDMEREDLLLPEEQVAVVRGKGFDPDQERDEHGRWSGAGGGREAMNESLNVETQKIRDAGPPGIRLEAFVASGGDLYVDTIQIPKPQQGEGHGTRAMEALIAWADERGLVMSLNPESDPGKRTALREFYRSLGFGPKSSSRFYDATAHGSWVRPAKKKKSEGKAFDPDQPRDEGGRWTDGGGGGGGVESSVSLADADADIVGSRTTPPSEGRAYNPDVRGDRDGDGVYDSARVGIPANNVPPPPETIPRLPNLSEDERKVEDQFARQFEADPEALTAAYRETVTGDPPTFATDDAKMIDGNWNPPGATEEDLITRRQMYNTALHQTANAVAKRAFVAELDKLKPGDRVLVTVGGCGAGKGFALKNVDDTKSLKGLASVVWDSAGDQNATENPWIQREVEARGLKATYVFVHNDPLLSWGGPPGNPERGVLFRANKEGRMVDAAVFADSYVLGYENHRAFWEHNRDNKNAEFIFLDNQGKPSKLDRMPELKRTRKEIHAFARKTIRENRSKLRPSLRRGALAGLRIWSDVFSG